MASPQRRVVKKKVSRVVASAATASPPVDNGILRGLLKSADEACADFSKEFSPGMSETAPAGEIDVSASAIDEEILFWKQQAQVYGVALPAELL